MDDHAQPTSSPAKGRGRGRGRGAAKANGVKNAGVKKPAAGRRGRQKVYENSKVQAAYERERELKQNYSAVVNAIRPALEDLADRNIDKLKESTDAHQEVDDFVQVQKALDQQLASTIAKLERERDIKLAYNEHVHRQNTNVTRERITNTYDEMMDDFLDAQLNRVAILEHLHKHGLPVDLRDDQYDYRPISRWDAEHIGPYQEVRDGVLIPNPWVLDNKQIQQPAVKVKGRGAKRKAEGEPDGQRNTKKAETTNEDEPAIDAPRHPGGIMSAVAPPDDGAEDDSKRPTPSPAASPEAPLSPATAGPGSSRAPAAATAGEGASQKHVRLPLGVSEPDAQGFRIVNRRRTQTVLSNNRIMAPSIVHFKDHEIGFRDSTNDKSRGATKAKRGELLGKPNSGSMHFDRTICQHNAAENTESDLDQDLVKKHKLHPRYGIFMPNSVNEAEPPKAYVSGRKPVVFVNEEGITLQASRSIRRARIDSQLAAYDQKRHVAVVLKQYCLSHDIPLEDIEPTEDDIDAYRESLKLRGLLSVRQTDATESEQSIDTARETEQALREADMEAINDGARMLLQAAQEIEAGKERASQAHEAAAELLQMPMEQTKIAAPTSQRPTGSRPYDAIRDVFTNAEPSPPRSTEPDTTSLSLLADMSERLRTSEDDIQRLPANGLPSIETEQQAGAAPTNEPVQNNAFLQTALNPNPVYRPNIEPALAAYGAPIAPAPQHDPFVPAGRMPFSSSGQAKGGIPGLPPLRPPRRQTSVVDPTPTGPPPPLMGPGLIAPPDTRYSPPRQELPMTNGPYYPPLPNRPFQNGYPLQEQASHLVPIMPHPHPPQVQPPLPPPQHAFIHHQPPLPPGPGEYIPMSPTYPNQTLGPVAMAHSPTESLQANGPPGSIESPHHRGSISSPASQQPGGKYRKLEPAPTPPHRMGWTNNGPELRTIPYDYQGIKDYSVVEPPPRHGPTLIRGWNHHPLKKSRSSKDLLEPEREESK